MSLPVDERLLAAQYYLIKQKEDIRARKIQLYQQFRTFALNKLKTYGHPFQVKFRSINGDPGLKYKEVDIGDEFYLIYGSFDFDPKTNLMTNYVRNEFRGTKTKEDINELISKTTDKLQQFRKFQQTLDQTTELEQIKIDKRIRQKVDKILEGIFKGELVFDEPEFKKLVDMNIALEKELKELDIRIAAVSLINGSSELDKSDDKSMEQTSNGAAIIDFLKTFNGPYIDADPSLAVVALGQQEDSKKR